VKGVRAKDLRGNDPEELRRTVRKLAEDLFKHRMKKNTNQLENTMLIRNTRRDIARVNTVLAERTRAAGTPAATAPAAGKSEAAAGNLGEKSKRASKKTAAQAKNEET
jgi:large subunit ribosomal protein L29